MASIRTSRVSTARLHSPLIGTFVSQSVTCLPTPFCSSRATTSITCCARQATPTPPMTPTTETTVRDADPPTPPPPSSMVYPCTDTHITCSFVALAWPAVTVASCGKINRLNTSASSNARVQYAHALIRSARVGRGRALSFLCLLHVAHLNFDRVTFTAESDCSGLANLNDNCARWAARYECVENPGYMNVYCGQSCCASMVCPRPPPHPASPPPQRAHILLVSPLRVDNDRVHVF